MGRQNTWRRIHSPLSQGDAQQNRTKLDRILCVAAELFSRQGFARTSMRQLSGKARISLAGLYYYVTSKERLLFLLQKQVFTSLMDELKSGLSDYHTPQARLDYFIYNHLHFFLEHMSAMKVLSHESEALQGELLQEIRQIKRRYYRIAAELVADAAPALKHRPADLRLACLSLFGMVNWIYTWYRTESDGNARRLAYFMSGIFQQGLNNFTARSAVGRENYLKSKSRSGSTTFATSPIVFETLQSTEQDIPLSIRR